MKMHKWIATAAVLFAAAASAHADDNDWARSMFAELKHDFGVLTKGLDARHEITITNPYRETITITDVSTTCGCTAGKASKRTLAPGESAVVEIKMNTVKFKRHKNSNVDVSLRTERGRTADIRIPIHAYIREDVTLSADTVNFGTVARGDAQEQSISVAHSGRGSWRIVGVRPAGKGVAVSYSEPRRVNGKTIYDLTFRIDESAPTGEINGDVIVLTEEPGRSYLSVPIRGRVEPSITVATSVIKMGAVKPSAKSLIRVVVRGLRPFAIEGIEPAGGSMTASVNASDAMKKVHVVPMQVETPATPGPFSEEFAVSIVGEDEPLRFTVEGEVMPPISNDPLVSDASGEE